MKYSIVLTIDDPRFEQLGSNNEERLEAWLQGMRDGFFEPFADRGVRVQADTRMAAEYEEELRWQAMHSFNTGNL